MKHLVISLLFLLISQISFGETLWVAHKGTWKDFIYPQNTEQALERALQKGFKGIEFDVQSTKDGVFVLGHDDGLTRVTNCKGKISEKIFAEIQNCLIDYSATWTVGQVARRKVLNPTKISTLVNTLRRFVPDSRVEFVWVDFKIQDLNIVPNVVNMLKELSPEERSKILFNNGSLEFLSALRQELPDLKTSFEEKLGGEPLRKPDFYFSKKGTHLDMIGLNLGLSLGHEPLWKLIGRRSRMMKMIPEFMERARTEGVPVIFWTVSKEPLLEKLLKFNPDYILTDLPYLPQF